MQKKVSNYIAEKLLESGITDVFLITGGGAMHLDDALGHQEGLHCMYRRGRRLHGFDSDVCDLGPGPV